MIDVRTGADTGSCSSDASTQLPSHNSYLCRWSRRKANVSLLAFGSSAMACNMMAVQLSSSASSGTKRAS